MESLKFTRMQDIEFADKQLFILRGISGAGKSTLVGKLGQKINKNKKHFTVCSADFFFMKNGKYNFDVSKLGLAHKFSQTEAENSMKDNIHVVFIDNTNLKYWEMKPYIKMAKKYGYTVNVIQLHTDIETILKRQFSCKNLSKDKVLQMKEKFDKAQLPPEIVASTIHVQGE